MSMLMGLYRKQIKNRYLIYMVMVSMLFGGLFGAVIHADAGITYDAGINTIIVTGGSLGSEYNFNDIYNADVAGGWGVVSKQSDQYYIISNIDIGDTSDTETWFADTGKHVIIDNPGGWQWVTVYINAHLRFGECVSDINQTTKNGCCIKFKGSNYINLIAGETVDGKSGHFEAYSSQFIYDAYGNGYIGNFYNFTAYNCIFGNRIQIVYMYDAKINNIVISGVGYGLAVVTGNISNVRIEDASLYGVYFSSSYGNVTMKNCEFVNSTVLVKASYTRIPSKTLYVIDFITDTWKMDYYNFNGKILRQYTFNLKVIDEDGNGIDNATVILKDKDGNTADQKGFSTTTNADGVITEQTISYGYYNQANGNTLQSYSPHTLKINATNYSDYECKFNLTAKTNWIITLENRSWNYSQPLAWKIINLTDTTILKLSSDGNLAIAGVLYELTNTPPLGNTVAYQINDTLWLTKSGDLYIEGEVSEEINSALLVNSIATIFGISYLVYRKKKKGGNHDKNK